MLHVTAKNFEQEVREEKLPVVVMFYAIWCGKCAMMKPIAEETEEKYQGKVKFCEVEIEESAVLAAQYETDVVPTFVFFQSGEVIGVMQGIVEEGLFEERIQNAF